MRLIELELKTIEGQEAAKGMGRNRDHGKRQSVDDLSIPRSAVLGRFQWLNLG